MSGNGGDTQAGLHDDALSLGQLLAKLAIKRILAPLVVAGHIGLDEAIEQIKLEVVAALADTGEANGFLAGHVSKSRSWFQDYLRRAREEERRPTVPVDCGEEAPPESGETYRLMSAVVVTLLSAYPATLTMKQLREAVDVPHWTVTDDELARQLQFYCKLGALQIAGYDRQGPIVQANGPFPVTAPRPGQVEALGKKLGAVMPMAIAYCQGRGDFGGFVGSLSPRALAKARRRLREAAADIFAEAIADTHKSDEPADMDVKVRVIIAIGEIGGSDE